ncbi:MAG: OsmC family protein [Cyclonatronaceae bacterium]
MFTSSSKQFEVSGFLVDQDQLLIAGLSVMLLDENDEQLSSDQSDSLGRFTLVYQTEPTSADPQSVTDMPAEFQLGASNPNPFKPRTTVPVYSPENARIRITVHNILGQLVLRSQAEIKSGNRRFPVSFITGSLYFSVQVLFHHPTTAIIMKSTSKLIDNFRSVTDNGRYHSVVLDLTPKGGGNDTGPTALELSLMSLSGCLTTIFAVMAKKMRLTYEGLEVTVEGEKSEDINTISWITIKATIQTGEEEKKVQKCLNNTIENCPVGILFRRADVEITSQLEIQAVY